ncbi:hypothetical protein EVA_22652 [gut metagenome]|uniref:Uncharacterized protein n=1 Tax=gut metagenome TaxID=749906 RepID=J9FHW8_9ZZZZ
MKIFVRLYTMLVITRHMLLLLLETKINMNVKMLSMQFAKSSRLNSLKRSWKKRLR